MAVNSVTDCRRKATIAINQIREKAGRFPTATVLPVSLWFLTARHFIQPAVYVSRLSTNTGDSGNELRVAKLATGQAKLLLQSPTTHWPPSDPTR